MWTSTQLAYLAGIIDGEGCITALYNSKRNKYITHVGVVSTNYCLVNWLKSIFGGSIYTRKPQKNRPNDKTKYEWVIYPKTIDKLIPQIMPYLIIKKTHSKIFMNYRKTFSSSHSGKLVAQNILNLRKSYYQQFKILNRQRKAR